jgi:hypothetical protein
MKFEVEIFSPDGPFTTQELTEIIDEGVVSQRENGKAYRLLVYYDKQGNPHTCQVKLLEE